LVQDNLLFDIEIQLYRQVDNKNFQNLLRQVGDRTKPLRGGVEQPLVHIFDFVAILKVVSFS